MEPEAGRTGTGLSAHGI